MSWRQVHTFIHDNLVRDIDSGSIMSTKQSHNSPTEPTATHVNYTQSTFTSFPIEADLQTKVTSPLPTKPRAVEVRIAG